MSQDTEGPDIKALLYDRTNTIITNVRAMTIKRRRRIFTLVRRSADWVDADPNELAGQCLFLVCDNLSLGEFATVYALFSDAKRPLSLNRDKDKIKAQNKTQCTNKTLNTNTSKRDHLSQTKGKKRTNKGTIKVAT